uniref:Uncharacterized protein n=1 Tax=Clytia hemisphaerica TaxID=252671 RepID=A0A7M5XKT3_9CNID
MEAFKKFSLTHFQKHKGHPKSPYDPLTMEPAEFSTPKPSMQPCNAESPNTPSRRSSKTTKTTPCNAESPNTPSRRSSKTTPTPAKKRKQYDTSMFLEESYSDDEENNNSRLELSSINDSREHSQQKEEITTMKKMLNNITNKIAKVEKQNELLQSKVSELS